MKQFGAFDLNMPSFYPHLKSPFMAQTSSRLNQGIQHIIIQTKIIKM